MSNNSDMYFPKFSGRSCEIRAIDNRLIRKFMMKADVINAQITGAGQNAKIAITTKDGKTYVYKSDGSLVRAV